MEYLTGKTEKKTLGIQDILAGEYEGKEVTVNGAVHKIRDMGDVAFVVLRKSEGLLQTVYEDGVTDISLKELQEALWQKRSVHRMDLKSACVP